MKGVRSSLVAGWKTVRRVSSSWQPQAAARPVCQIETLEGRTLYSAGLDLDFGHNGSFTLDAAGGKLDFADVTAVQADGKILVAGGTTVHSPLGGDHNRGILLRLKTDGTLDTTFGGTVGGYVVSGVEQADAYFDHIYALAVQPDGKIIAAGSIGESSEIKFAVARFNADGTLDPTFGSGRGAGRGFATINVGPLNEFATAIAIAPGGKIVVAGHAGFGKPGDGGDFGVARFNADGTPDTTFSGDGAAVVDFKPTGAVWGEDYVRSVVIDAEGNILLGGVAAPIFNPGEGLSASYFAMARLKDDGELDEHFGDGGKVRTLLAGEAGGTAPGEISSLFILPDGRILAGGQSGTNYARAVVLRYGADGHLDSTFGDAGMARMSTGDHYYHGFRYNWAADGSFTVYSLTEQEAVIGKFSAQGQATELGRRAWTEGSAFVEITNFALLPDGSLVGVGRVSQSRAIFDWIKTNDLLVVRLDQFPLVASAIAPPAPLPPPLVLPYFLRPDVSQSGDASPAPVQQEASEPTMVTAEPEDDGPSDEVSVMDDIPAPDDEQPPADDGAEIITPRIQPRHLPVAPRPVVVESYFELRPTLAQDLFADEPIVA